MTEIIFCTIKTIIGYFLLLFLSTNLLGGIVRGFYDQVDISGVHPLLLKEIQKHNKSSNFITLFFILVTIGFYYLLNHFWGIGVVITFAILMLGRLPDLLWEINNGRKITTKNHPEGILSIISTLVVWSAIVVLWFALY